MLNELLIAERGARKAGLEIAERHPDLKDAGKMPTLLVCLDRNAAVASIRPLPVESHPWTLRDGQHNSFPFVKPEAALWTLCENDERREPAAKGKTPVSRESLLALAREATFNERVIERWPGSGLLKSLDKRRGRLTALMGTEAQSFVDSMDRFRHACNSDEGGDPQRFFLTVMQQLVEGVQRSGQADWLRIASALLFGKYNAERNRCGSEGALLLDSSDATLMMADPGMAARVSQALLDADGSGGEGSMGVSGLSGSSVRLVTDNFPQPTLPILGQTWLFSKNSEIPANDRYGRFASDAMPVGADEANRAAGALVTLTRPDREGITWRGIPGETPKQTDLLLVFVDEAPDAPVAGLVTGDEEEVDFSEEATKAGQSAAASIAAYEKRAERVVDSIRAKVSADFRKAPVRIAILRKVDPANRKVIYAGSPTVGELHLAATDWVAGERNVPSVPVGPR
ncbi:MAG: hypothetical protein ACRELE_05485, partial [Gemmatimonadales bacterium]